MKMGIPNTRQKFVQAGVEAIENLIGGGQLSSARKIVDKNRSQARARLDRGDPLGELGEKLSQLQAKGLIDDLYTVGNFSGKLKL